MASSSPLLDAPSASSVQRLLTHRALRPLLPALSRGLAILDPFGTQFAPLEPATRYRPARRVRWPDTGPDELRVMSWNIKFAGARLNFFYDHHGDRVHMTPDEVIGHLGGLRDAIDQLEPDVILLQEVDIDSTRSAHIDQLQWLLDHLARPYHAVYAPIWRASLVPSHDLGAMDMGNAILSRFPIGLAQREALPEIGTQDPVTRYFYIKRNLLTAEIALGPAWPRLSVVNTHTSAYAPNDATKRLQLEAFTRRSLSVDRAGHLLVAGGDLNTVPPGSAQIFDFADVAQAEASLEGLASDYRRERGWIDPMYAHFHPAIALSAYHGDNAAYATHSTTADVFWNRKLDYLFSNRPWASGLVVQSRERGGVDTMGLSDHAPVIATLKP